MTEQGEGRDAHLVLTSRALHALGTITTDFSSLSPLSLSLSWSLCALSMLFASLFSSSFIFISLRLSPAGPPLCVCTRCSTEREVHALRMGNCLAREVAGLR